MRLKHIAKNWLRRAAVAFEDRDGLLEPPAPGGRRVEAPLNVLVIGVYLGGQPNAAAHLVRRFEESGHLRVQQRWTAIGSTSDDQMVADRTCFLQRSRRSKFELLNRLLEGVDLGSYDFVVASDDDIFLRSGFLEKFLKAQRRFGFALSQPSRTWSSYNDHLIVLRRPWFAARETRFVECGPLVSFDRRAASLLLPFEPDTPLWGVDLVWPAVLMRHGLTLGIVDSVSVAHVLREQAKLYNASSQSKTMDTWLSERPHLSWREAIKTVRRYV